MIGSLLDKIKGGLLIERISLLQVYLDCVSNVVEEDIFDLSAENYTPKKKNDLKSKVDRLVVEVNRMAQLVDLLALVMSSHMLVVLLCGWVDNKSY